jgi:hypothetical protein
MEMRQKQMKYPLSQNPVSTWKHGNQQKVGGCIPPGICKEHTATERSNSLACCRGPVGGGKAEESHLWAATRVESIAGTIGNSA